jgi:hypothetical protein
MGIRAYSDGVSDLGTLPFGHAEGTNIAIKLLFQSVLP